VRTIGRPFILSFTAVVVVLACSGGEPQMAYADSAPATNAATAQASASAESIDGELLRFVLAPTGNAVRYRVRERLV
jgi:hypothetical protein